MAASEHASHLTEVINATQRASDLKFLFEEHPNGLIYARGDEILESLAKLLPKSVAAAAGMVATLSSQCDRTLTAVCSSPSLQRRRRAVCCDMHIYA